MGISSSQVRATKDAETWISISFDFMVYLGEYCDRLGATVSQIKQSLLQYTTLTLSYPSHRIIPGLMSTHHSKETKAVSILKAQRWVVGGLSNQCRIGKLEQSLLSKSVCVGWKCATVMVLICQSPPTVIVSFYASSWLAVDVHIKEKESRVVHMQGQKAGQRQQGSSEFVGNERASELAPESSPLAVTQITSNCLL